MGSDLADNKFKILVCESDTRLLQRLELWVKTMGYEPIVCDDGIMALQSFEEKKPDIVIVSQNINSMGSIEFIEKIKSIKSSQIVVLLLNEDVDSSIFKRTVDLQVDRYLNKPLDANAVFYVIELLSKYLEILSVSK